MLKTIATKLALKFKSFPYLGRTRFWILYWAYKITGWHIRHKEWDFILEYLPPLHNDLQAFDVLDIGCSRNLLCHEIIGRGYMLCGVDLEEPEFKYPDEFLKLDIVKDYVLGCFDFVTCISVLEHIGLNGRGHFPDQKKALENMCRSLKVGGRFLLTTPTREFAEGHIWHGFTWADIKSILPKTMRVIESTERAGQICLAAERVA